MYNLSIHTTAFTVSGLWKSYLKGDMLEDWEALHGSKRQFSFSLLGQVVHCKNPNTMAGTQRSLEIWLRKQRMIIQNWATANKWHTKKTKKQKQKQKEKKQKKNRWIFENDSKRIFEAQWWKNINIFLNNGTLAWLVWCVVCLYWNQTKLNLFHH